MPGIFADRQTELVFNDYLPSVAQPALAMERSAEQMCRTASSIVSSMQRISHVGWQLQSYTMDAGDRAWLTAAAPGYLSVANGATVAPHHVEEPTFVKPSIPGVTYAAGVQDEGAPMIRVKVPASVTDWGSLRLTDDQVAFGSPSTDEDLVSMDRVYSFAGINPWDALSFDVEVPASILSARGTFATFYFMGPAGVDADGAANPKKIGLGHYALKLRADGRAYLYEMLADGGAPDQGTWKARFSFFWNTDSEPVPGSLISITIVSRMWQDAQGRYLGDRMVFLPSSMTTARGVTGLLERLTDVALLAIRLAAKLEPVYNVPRLLPVPTVVPHPVRIDIARGCRASFAVSKHVYKPAGYLLDDNFSFDQAITTSSNIYFYLQGVIPSGTSVEIKLADADGNALAPTSGVTVANTAQGQTAYQSFRPRSGMRGVRVQVTAHGAASGTVTPTIVSYSIYRLPVYAYDNPLGPVLVPSRSEFLPALPRTTIDSVTINPQETDPGGENATFEVTDLTGELGFLGQRNMVPVLCRTTTTIADGTPDGTPGVSDLFRGYVLQATGTALRTTGAAYPSSQATRWTLQCVGEWSRTTEALAPRLKAWGQNPVTGLPFRVTDLIEYYAQQVYPPEMVAVPSLDVLLQSADPSAYIQEANARMADSMAELCSDYLGSYMVFDASAGSKGVLRMLEQKHAPYTNLAIFEMDHPTVLAGDGFPRIPQWAGSYPSHLVGANHVPSTWIRGGYNHWLEKAEGNCVTVYGAAIGNDANASAAADGAMLVQNVLNVRSYNFLGLAPGSDGYPDGSSPEFYNRIVPIRAVDWKCGSPTAVNWKARRIFEKSCFARYYLSFDAPLLTVFDPSDPLQVRPRRIRFYDAALVRQPDGSLAQFIVVSCTPTYTKDHLQMARYVLVTQSNIDTIGVVDKGSSVLKAFLRGFGRATGANWQHGPPVSAQQKQGEPVASQIMGLPDANIPAIQDIDPSSATFGQFVGMASFDAIPHA